MLRYVLRYDTPAVRDMVAGWVAWFKQHRDILTSDIVHIRRPDGQSVDGIVHVNPSLPELALAAFFNPTTQPLRVNVTLPLYYAGVAPGIRLTVTRSMAPQSPEVYNVTASARSRITFPAILDAHSHGMYIVTSI